MYAFRTYHSMSNDRKIHLVISPRIASAAPVIIETHTEITKAGGKAEIISNGTPVESPKAEAGAKKKTEAPAKKKKA